MEMDWSWKIVSEWRQVAKEKRGRNKMENPNSIMQMAKWSPPAEGYLKINVDAAVQREIEVASIGMVIRDHKGTFVEGRVRKLLNQDSVFAVEAMGVCEAVDWAVEK